jgi:hypothetical protein
VTQCGQVSIMLMARLLKCRCVGWEKAHSPNSRVGKIADAPLLTP